VKAKGSGRTHRLLEVSQEGSQNALQPEGELGIDDVKWKALGDTLNLR